MVAEEAADIEALKNVMPPSAASGCCTKLGTQAYFSHARRLSHPQSSPPTRNEKDDAKVT